MSRLIRILCVVVVCELVAAAVILSRPTVLKHDSQAPQPPSPDLAFLDSITAQEIIHRRERVTSDRAEDWRALAEIYVLYGFFAEADICCQRAAALDPEEFWTYLWWGTALSRLGQTSESTQKFYAGISRTPRTRSLTCAGTASV